MNGPARRRRIAHVVVSDGFAGVERYICDATRELADRGWALTVVGGDRQLLPPRLDPRVHHVAAGGIVAAAATLARGHHDLVHVHMTAAEFAAVAGVGMRRRPIVSTRHFAAPRGSSALARALGGAASRRIDRQIAISRYVAGTIGQPSVVIPNGVPTHDLILTERRDATVLLMQRHEPEKHTDVAIRAWQRASARHRGWRLTIAGSGVETPALQRLARELDVADSIDFLGFVDNPSDLLATAGLLLATAPAEPLGLSVLEAMSWGLPVVAADGGGHRESLADLGRLFRPDDVDACAVAVDEVTEAASSREEIGRALWARQRELFTLDAHVDALDELYRGLLDA